MNRRTIIAALTAVGAVSLAAAPALAQQSPTKSRLVSEAAPKQSGALPMPTLQPGDKLAVTTEAGGSSDAKTMSLSTAAPSLPIK